MPKTLSPFSRPFYMMAKPVGAACNLACGYCYYKGGHPDEERGTGSSGRVMSDEVLERFIQQYLESQVNQEVLFTWHGGEPTILPISFFEKAMQLQQCYAAGRHIDNCLQTNGTLITDEWCQFFHDNGWLIGLSIDGPEALHDAWRKDKHGEPTHERVMRAAEMLDRHNVMWNALCTVNSINAEHPLEVYRFFQSIDCRYIQFTPVGANPASGVGRISAQAWGRFLCEVFDEWRKEDVGEVFINIFEATLANYMGITPGICAMSDMCGHVGVVEWNGDVYSCDHFVYPEHRLGNLRQQTICEMMQSRQQQTFSRQKTTGLPQKCKDCEWLFTCHGECPRNHQYLCEGYRTFFRHADEFMKTMRDEIRI